MKKHLKIAIVGHGRMGHQIEKTAIERGHKIVAVIDVDNQEDFRSDAFRSADVAIEFSIPSQAPDNILRCFEAGVPVVCGTTGWLDALPGFRKMCEKGEGTLFYSSNYSIGVNIFRAVNRTLASIMEGFPQYEPSVEEIHHIHKLDHPSGTAISIADDILDRVGRKRRWAEPDSTAIGSDILLIGHQRIGEIPGKHIVTWDSPEDTIRIEHDAKSRAGLALGAVVAAEWLRGRQGFFTMEDMFPNLFKN